MDREYHTPPEEYQLPPEYSPPGAEVSGVSPEVSSPAPEHYLAGSEFNEDAGEEEVKRRRKRMAFSTSVIAQVAAAAVSVVVIHDAFGIDLLGYDVFAHPDKHHEDFYEWYEEWIDPWGKDGDYEDWDSGDDWDHGGSQEKENMLTASYGFPSLTNLDPNGFVPGYGVLDEQYIVLGEATVLLYRDGVYERGDIEGVTYDESTNTLTIENVMSEELLDINLMGNGFKLRVEGQNRLGAIRVWGFYYGGSLTVTGTGSLTVNELIRHECGIQLLAEESESCLMVDSGVTLSVYGSEAAIEVNKTTAARPVYFMYPGTVSGAETFIDYEGTESFRSFRLCDGGGNVSTRVFFR